MLQTQSIAVKYPDITDEEFRTIAQFIEKNVGIKMPESKRLMMQSRLTSQLRKLGLSSYKEYIDYVFHKDAKGEELVLMIDSLTTNKTEFFREADHFDYMTRAALPAFEASNRSMVKIWSAGCSSGEEPYTLCMVMSEFMRKTRGKINNFTITGTDISTKVLDKAYNAVYDIKTLEELPLELKRSYFLKGSNPEKQQARVKPDLRRHVNFRRLNFMDDDFCMPEIYDIIFCRNVLIYFDKPTQEGVIRKFLRYLQPDGYLFLGHSETILAKDMPLKSVAPTVYVRT